MEDIPLEERCLVYPDKAEPEPLPKEPWQQAEEKMIYGGELTEKDWEYLLDTGPVPY